ncbi:unnamed protein product, partial [Owenia fusiformis]
PLNRFPRDLLQYVLIIVLCIAGLHTKYSSVMSQDATGLSYTTGMSQDPAYGTGTTPHATGITQDPQQGPGYGTPSDIFTQDTTICSCQQCGREFPSKACLESHTLLIHNHFCSVCNARVDEELDVESHGMKHIGLKPVHCENCFKLFNAPSGLVNHLAKDLKCLLCQKTFTVRSKAKHLKLHQM